MSLDFDRLQKLVDDEDLDNLLEFLDENHLEIVEGKIYSKDKVYAKSQSEFYDQRQLIKKILLNS